MPVPIVHLDGGAFTACGVTRTKRGKTLVRERVTCRACAAIMAGNAVANADLFWTEKHIALTEARKARS